MNDWDLWFRGPTKLFAIDRGSEALKRNVNPSTIKRRERFETGLIYFRGGRSMEGNCSISRTGDGRLTLLTLIKRGVNAAWITILMDSLN